MNGFKNDIISYYFFKFFRTISFIISNTFLPIFLYIELSYSIFEIALFSIIIHAFLIPSILYSNKIIGYVWVKKTIAFHIITTALFFYLLQYLTWNFTQDIFFIILLAAIRSIPKWFYSTAEVIFINEKILKFKSKFWKPLSYIHIITIVSSICAPIIGGVITYYIWFIDFFTIIALFSLIGVIPLLITQDFHLKFEAGYKKTIPFILKEMDRNLIKAIFGQDFSSSLVKIIWPIFIIITVKTTLNVWWLLSLSSFITIIFSYIVGKYIDKKKSREYKYIINIFWFAYFIRALFPHPFLLLITDSINKIITPIWEIPFDKYVYEYIHRFKNTSFVTNAMVFVSEFMYLLWCITMALYFWILEYFSIPNSSLTFIWIFFIFWISILAMKSASKIKLPN